MSRRASALMTGHACLLACGLACLLAVAPAASAASSDGAAATHATTRVSDRGGHGEPNDASFTPSISRDGRWVTFASEASNLVPGDTNHRRDVFLRSSAHNLRPGSPGAVTDVYLVDHAGTVLDWVSRSLLGGEPNGGSGDISLSRDGQAVALRLRGRQPGARGRQPRRRRLRARSVTGPDPAGQREQSRRRGQRRQWSSLDLR